MSLWNKHRILEKNSILLLIGILLVISVGGIVEIAPLFYLKSTIEAVAGVRPYTSLGFLEYSFIETVEAMHPFYVIRALGGALFLAGALIMVWNLWKTVFSTETSSQAAISRPALVPAE